MSNSTAFPNPWLDGNVDQFAEFARQADEGPVFMLNLLRFRAKSSGGDETGAQAYARYGGLAAPFVEKHGGRLVWAGAPTQQLVGDMDYAWDAVLLVSWPKRQNLIDLGNDEGYRAIAHHRMDALDRTMLIAMNMQGQFQLPG
jgi:uncharacterized protein (DUF1330 family)